VKRHARLVSSTSIVLALFGCGAHVDRRLGQIEQRQSELDLRVAVDERRAADLHADTLQLQYVLDAQRRCIAWQECRAQTSRIEAEVMAKLAACNMKTANWFACDAQRTKDTAEGAGLGCLLGWGFAIMTGGSAAPAVLIGCGAGAATGSSGSTGSCTTQPKPQPCGRMGPAFQTEALWAHGLTDMPVCGPMPEECAALNFSSR
jgi:hypothetical protein